MAFFSRRLHFAPTHVHHADLDILSIQAAYGNYTLAGAVSAINIIALAVTAPMWARFVDRYGQLKVMGPVFAV